MTFSSKKYPRKINEINFRSDFRVQESVLKLSENNILKTKRDFENIN